MTQPPSAKSELTALREFLGEDRDRWSDGRMEDAICEAKEWVGGRRYSWKVAAASVLRDGYSHA